MTTIRITPENADVFLALRELVCAVCDYIDPLAPSKVVDLDIVRKTEPATLFKVEYSTGASRTPADHVRDVLATARAANEASRASQAARPAHKQGKPYTAAQRERILGKVRKHQRRKHKHPVTAAAAEAGLPHQTVMRWARDAGLVA